MNTRKTLPPPTAPPISKFTMTKTGIVRNPTIGTNQFLPRSISQKPALFQLPSQYLTVSSEETSTYTELEGDDLVDVDYVSEYSLDLSNDEDEEENFEDLQTEIYLQNLFYSIDRLTFDDFVNDIPSTLSIIELPKNLIAECHVWRQKFRFKKLNTTKSKRTSINVGTTTRLRPRRTSTEQASISKVAEWNVENLQQNSIYKFSSVNPNETVNLDKSVTVARSKGASMHSQPNKTLQVQSVSSRITLPPIINPKRPQSNDLMPPDTSKNNNKSLELKANEGREQNQHKQIHPLQTSQSFNEQTESNYPTNRTSASSSYSRITLNDLLDHSSNSSTAWNHRIPANFQSSHMLKLPVIKS